MLQEKRRSTSLSLFSQLSNRTKMEAWLDFTFGSIVNKVGGEIAFCNDAVSAHRHTIPQKLFCVSTRLVFHSPKWQKIVPSTYSLLLKTHTRKHTKLSTEISSVIPLIATSKAIVQIPMDCMNKSDRAPRQKVKTHIEEIQDSNVTRLLCCSSPGRDVAV